MKRFWLTLLLILFFCSGKAQNLYLTIKGSDYTETKKIDSIGYNKKFTNAKGVVDEIELFNRKLFESGYLENEKLSNKKINDSTFLLEYRLGKGTSHLFIHIEEKMIPFLSDNYETNDGILKLPIENIQPLMNSILKRLETTGYSLAQLKLESFRVQQNSLHADLIIKPNQKRALNNIVFEGFEKFPESHKKNLRKTYAKQIFNQSNLEKLYNDIEKFRFVKQVKYPEILFTKDSTKIYVYLEKAKANTFDGYIGFTNNEQDKVVFSGYLDLVLNNVLNSGEKLSLFWKSDGQEQRTFNLGVELPYIFKSPFGIKANLNIFKQDSTFQNTRTSIDLGYYFNYTTKAYIGYQSSESSDIQNINSTTLSDFESTFYNVGFEYSDFKSDDFLFPEKSFFDIRIGTGKRDTNTESINQFYSNLIFRHNLYLNSKNIINLKSQNFYLQSTNYLVNELFRFGGINSIRGFNENSLQANLLTSILTEYRYILTPNLYVHSIVDYGYFKDNTSNTNGTLLGLGFGIGLQTKNGLFNLVYANGSTDDQTAKLSNSIIHISLKASF